MGREWKHRRRNQYIPNRYVFVPPPIEGVKLSEEKSEEEFDIGDLKKYHAKLQRGTKTLLGQKRLACKRKLIKRLHGLEVWTVKGDKLRKTLGEGEAPFERAGHAYKCLYIPRYEIWIDEVYTKPKEREVIIWREYLERLLMLRGKTQKVAATYADKLEEVLRESEFFILPVGTYRQGVPWTCGPAAVKIVLDFLRWPVSEEHLAKLTGTTKRIGSNPGDLVWVARKMNFVADDRNRLTVSEVKGLIREGTPVIANYQFEPEFGEGHYAVIIGFSKDKFVLSDPGEDEGYVVVEIKEFMEKWYELEDKTVRQGIIIRVP